MLAASYRKADSHHNTGLPTAHQAKLNDLSGGIIAESKGASLQFISILETVHTHAHTNTHTYTPSPTVTHPHSNKHAHLSNELVCRTSDVFPMMQALREYFFDETRVIMYVGAELLLCYNKLGHSVLLIMLRFVVETNKYII